MLPYESIPSTYRAHIGRTLEQTLTESLEEIIGGVGDKVKRLTRSLDAARYSTASHLLFMDATSRPHLPCSSPGEVRRLLSPERALSCHWFPYMTVLHTAVIAVVIVRQSPAGMPRGVAVGAGGHSWSGGGCSLRQLSLGRCSLSRRRWATVDSHLLPVHGSSPKATGATVSLSPSS